MNTFSLRILSSNRVFFDGEAVSLTLPGMDGEYGILAHHENTVIATKEGELRFTAADGTKTVAIVGIGYAEIADNAVTVLVDTAERPEEIDVRRAERAAARAKEELLQQRSLREHKITEAALARAMLRIKEGTKLTGL